MSTIDRDAVQEGVADLSPLWRPIKIGNVEIKNRVLVSAHGTSYPRDMGGGVISERYARYLERRAEGGAGLIVSMASAVDPRSAGPIGIHLFNEKNVPLARDLTSRIHRHGAKIFAQLFHGGYHADNSTLLDWSVPMSASQVMSPVIGRTAHALTEEEIAEIVELYGRGAAVARDSGYDGVELSAGHGYLVGQFFSPLTNRREDRYGGSVENRCRLAREIADSVRRHAGDDFPLGFRMSYDENLGENGITPDLSDDILREIDKGKPYAYISVSGGNYHTLHRLVSPSSSGLEANRVNYSARAKAIVGDDTPVMVAGAIRTVEVAAAVLASGSADMVVMARAHIADPDLVKKAQSGRVAETRHCIGSNTCWKRAAHGKHLACSVNPGVGREIEWLDGVTVASRDVVVVGGGPGGLKAAVVAAERGHRVALLERQDELGGNFKYMRTLPGRAHWVTLTDDLTAAAHRLGVDIRLGVDATPDVISKLNPDQVVLATGARFDHTGFSGVLPFQPSGIKGASDSTVIDPHFVLDNPSKVGKRVVIMEDSGDYTAVGIAIFLAERDHDVELVTPLPHVGVKLYPANEAPWLLPRAVKAGVRFTASSYVSDISPGLVTITSSFGGEPRVVEVDSVVLSMMRLQNNELSLALAKSDIPIQSVGDCASPGEVDHAVYAGEKAARAIA